MQKRHVALCKQSFVAECWVVSCAIRQNKCCNKINCNIYCCNKIIVFSFMLALILLHLLFQLNKINAATILQRLAQLLQHTHETKALGLQTTSVHCIYLHEIWKTVFSSHTRMVMIIYRWRVVVQQTHAGGWDGHWTASWCVRVPTVEADISRMTLFVNCSVNVALCRLAQSTIIRRPWEYFDVTARAPGNLTSTCPAASVSHCLPWVYICKKTTVL